MRDDLQSAPDPPQFRARYQAPRWLTTPVAASKSNVQRLTSSALRLSLLYQRHAVSRGWESNEDRRVMSRENESWVACQSMHPVLRLAIGRTVHRTEGGRDRDVLLEVLIHIHVVR